MCFQLFFLFLAHNRGMAMIYKSFRVLCDSLQVYANTPHLQIHSPMGVPKKAEEINTKTVGEENGSHPTGNQIQKETRAQTLKREL